MSLDPLVCFLSLFYLTDGNVYAGLILLTFVWLCLRGCVVILSSSCIYNTSLCNNAYVDLIYSCVFVWIGLGGHVVVLISCTILLQVIWTYQKVNYVVI